MIEIETPTTMSQQLKERFIPKIPKTSKPKKRGRKPKKETRGRKPITRTTFKQTPLGNFLIKNCPEEYELIMKAKADGVSITADVVESIAYRSDNPSFQLVAFRTALSDFRRYRCRTPNKVAFNADDEVEAIKRRLKLLD